MKPFFIFTFAVIILTSCNLPALETSTPLQIDSETPTIESDIEQKILSTVTPTSLIKPTSTDEPQPSPTLVNFQEAPTATPRDFPTPQPLKPGEPITITRIQMFDITTGWGTGYQRDSGARVLYTEDGGRTWKDRTPPEEIAEIPEQNESVWAHFHDPSTAWIIYASQGGPPNAQPPVIWRTTNGGLIWEPSNSLQVDGMEDFFTPEGFSSVGSDHGWLLVHVGAGMSHDYSYLFSTSDGGISWIRIADPYGIGIQSLHNTGLAFADPQFGWVSKDNLGVMPGAFFEQTTDGGSTWEQSFLPIPEELDWFNEVSLCMTSAPTFIDQQTGMLIVKCMLYEDIQKSGWSLTYIYRTTDRAETWKHVQLPSPVESVIILDENIAWAFGRDHYQTIDGGETWKLVKTVNWDGDFSFVDPLNGWAVARNEDEIALVVTVDGGLSWQIIKPTVR